MKKFLSLFLLGTALSTAFAAPAAKPVAATASDDKPTDEPTRRWYQVEMIIYKQKALAEGINETWPMDIKLAYPDYLLNLKNIAASTQQAGIANSDNLPVLLDDKQKNYLGLAKKLRLNNQAPLFHETWRQYLVQDDSTPVSIFISGGQQSIRRRLRIGSGSGGLLAQLSQFGKHLSFADLQLRRGRRQSCR